MYKEKDEKSMEITGDPFFLDNVSPCRRFLISEIGRFRMFSWWPRPKIGRISARPAAIGRVAS